MGLMASIAIVFAVQYSQAAPATTTLVAPVELVGTITITSPVAVNFGKIVPPVSGAPQLFTVNSNGTTSEVGSGEFVPGTATAGQVRVTGPDGTTVDLSSNINNVPGGVLCAKVPTATGDVNLTEILFRAGGLPGNPDVLVRTASMNGSAQTIAMGGALSVPIGATGSHNCTYNVDVVFTP